MAVGVSVCITTASEGNQWLTNQMKIASSVVLSTHSASHPVRICQNTDLSVCSANSPMYRVNTGVFFLSGFTFGGHQLCESATGDTFTPTMWDLFFLLAKTPCKRNQYSRASL